MSSPLASILLAPIPAYHFYNTAIGDMVIRAQDGGSNQKILIGLQTGQDATLTIENDRMRVFASIAMSNVTGEALLSSTGCNLGINQANAMYTLDVGGDAHIASNLTVDKDLNVLSSATFMSNLTVLGSLNSTTINFAHSNVTIYSTETITSNVLVDGTLEVVEKVTVDGPASFSNNLVVYGQTSLSNNAWLSSNLTVLGRSTLSNGIDSFRTLTQYNADSQFVVLSNSTGSQFLSASSNNLGLGNSNPQYTLDIAGSINFTGGIFQNGAVFSGWNSNEYGNYINSNAAFRGEATASDVLLMYTTNSNLACSFSNISGKTSLYGVSNYLGVGTVSPAYTLDVNGSVGAMNATMQNQLLVGSNIGIGTMVPAYPLDVQANTDGISVTCSAKVVATEFSVFSDRRLKRDITYVDNGSSLDALLGLQVCTFGYVDTEDRGKAIKTGLIAQEVEEVLPSCVVSTSGFVPDIMEEAVPVPVEGRVGVYDLQDLSRELAVGTHIKCRCSGIDVFATVIEAPCRVDFLKALHDPRHPLMVIGSRVADLKMLNFEQLTTLTISALQSQEQRLRAIENRLASNSV